MDACQFKLITGLSNYEGFKSLLKNGNNTKRYTNEDDTIIFNKIETTSLTAGIISLKINQVAVILDISSEFDVLLNTYAGLIITDVNGALFTVYPDQNFIGRVICFPMSFNNSPGLYKSVTYAIFDLF